MKTEQTRDLSQEEQRAITGGFRPAPPPTSHRPFSSDDTGRDDSAVPGSYDPVINDGPDENGRQVCYG